MYCVLEGHQEISFHLCLAPIQNVMMISQSHSLTPVHKSTHFAVGTNLMVCMLINLISMGTLTCS